MAERVKMDGTDYAIGVGVLLVAFVAVFFTAGAMNLGASQFLLSAFAAIVGIAVWFAIVRIRKR